MFPRRIFALKKLQEFYFSATSTRRSRGSLPSALGWEHDFVTWLLRRRFPGTASFFILAIALSRNTLGWSRWPATSGFNPINYKETLRDAPLDSNPGCPTDHLKRGEF